MHSFIILKINELVFKQRTLLVYLPHHHWRRTNHQVLNCLLVKTYRIYLSTSHRTQRTKTNHPIVHPFVRNVLVGFLSEKISLIWDQRFLRSKQRRVLFVLLAGRNELPGDFSHNKGLLLFDFQAVYYPESAVFLTTFHRLMKSPRNYNPEIIFFISQYKTVCLDASGIKLQYLIKLYISIDVVGLLFHLTGLRGPKSIS